MATRVETVTESKPYPELIGEPTSDELELWLTEDVPRRDGTATNPAGETVDVVPQAVGTRRRLPVLPRMRRWGVPAAVRLVFIALWLAQSVHYLLTPHPCTCAHP